MKKIKFIVLLLFIISGAGAVFYFGLVQIHLDKNTYGIAYTKTNGYLSKVYSPGTFSWSAYRLIPGNFKLNTFHIELETDTVTKEGVLPSGKTYSKYLPGQPDFTYKFSFTITYILNISKLPELLKKNRLTSETFSAFNSRTSQALSSAVIEIVMRKATGPETSNSTFFFAQTFLDSVKQVLQKQFPYLSIYSITPVEFSFPDISLYQKAKQNYFVNLDSIRKMEAEARLKASETVVRETSKIELLKRYGELFKKYPELVKLLADNADLRSEILPKISFSGKASHE